MIAGMTPDPKACQAPKVVLLANFEGLRITWRI